MVFVYTCLYVMSRFKSAFARQTTMLCNLSLFSSAFFTYIPLYSLLFICIHYVCNLFVCEVELVLVFACSPCSICLPGSRRPCCYKQEQARTAPLCPRAASERPEKLPAEVALTTEMLYFYKVWTLVACRTLSSCN